MPGSGVMKSLSTGDRVFVLPARTWALAEETLFQRFSTGAVVILQEMGETYGREFGLYLKEKKLDLATGKGLLQSLTRGAGWGGVTSLWGWPSASAGSSLGRRSAPARRGACGAAAKPV